jgi:hypothetical protein
MKISNELVEEFIGTLKGKRPPEQRRDVEAKIRCFAEFVNYKLEGSQHPLGVAATEAKYCPKCGHESVKNHLCKDATPVVGMLVDVHLDTDDMCGAEAGMSNVIRAKITSIEPPYLIVVDVENDEEFEVTPGQCVPALGDKEKQ